MVQNSQYFFPFALYQKNYFFNGTKFLIIFSFYIIPKKKKKIVFIFLFLFFKSLISHY